MTRLTPVLDSTGATLTAPVLTIDYAEARPRQLASGIAVQFTWGSAVGLLRYQRGETHIGIEPAYDGEKTPCQFFYEAEILRLSSKNKSFINR